MGQSFKAILQLIVIVAVFGAIIAWGAVQHPDQITWGFRIGCPLLIMVFGWVLVRSTRRKEILTDMLGQIVPNYFERNGVCFALVPTVADGICWMQIFFQNRYEKACNARIVLTPPKTFFTGKTKTAGLDVEIFCEGAAFGVYRAPWPINVKLQGKKVKCEVGCDASYPNGAGKLMRFREGLRCSAPTSGAARAAKAAGLAMIGVVRYSRPSSVTLQMPTKVADQIPPGLVEDFKTIWQPELPTGGFPVVMKTDD